MQVPPATNSEDFEKYLEVALLGAYQELYVPLMGREALGEDVCVCGCSMPGSSSYPAL